MRFASTDVKVFRKATVILTTAVGRSQNSITEDLGCRLGTGDNGGRRYRADAIGTRD